MFLVLYFKNVEGRLVEALHNPMTIAVLLLPFLPAIVMTFLAERARSKFISFLQSDVLGGDAKADGKKPEGKGK